MRLALLLAIAATASTPAWADDPQPPTPFDRGHFEVTLGGGPALFAGANYDEVGPGVAYYVQDGLSIGVSVFHEFGGSAPTFDQIAPDVRYIAQPLVETWPLVPYAEVFYKHVLDGSVGTGGSYSASLGGHAGLVVVAGQLAFAFGWAIEKQLSPCTANCVHNYPDLVLSFSF
jgi:hypothetical protein